MRTSLAPSRSSVRMRARVLAIVTAAVAIPGIAAASLAGSPLAEPAVSHLALMPTHSVMADVSSKVCPSYMAHVGTSCVDKYEGSLVEIAADGTESTFSPYEAPNGKNVRAVSRPGVVPQAHISMVEAKRACEASGKRLCKAAEWKTACKGPEHTRYPYGDKRVAGACVDTNRTSPTSRLYGSERSARTMNDPRLNQIENTVEKTGAADSCANGYGVHDMVGNVHEWTDDASFRGGYYLDTVQNGEGCDYRTTAHAPAYYDYSTGFRCCADEGFVGRDD